MINEAINQLIKYAKYTGLLAAENEVFCRNALLDCLRLESFREEETAARPLEDILEQLTGYALENALLDDSQAARDAFTTRLMGCLTPPPSEVQRKFWDNYALSPETATNWFYDLAQSSDYIRRYRTERDLRFKAQTDYGEMDITINLAKPEKDPRDIAAAKNRPAAGYPKCVLCPENEGYTGNAGHPARQNLRIIPLELEGEKWGFQYSPYVYYNEHCIVLSERHSPMVIDEACFRRLFAFVDKFPHYFVGSNADLPIVGGSILSHEHFQGGRYTFAMDKAPLKRQFSFPEFEDVSAGAVKWPMPVIRLEGGSVERLCALGGRILAAWREYSDASVGVLARTDGASHNTITPIARRLSGKYRLDLVLRNNRATPEYPLGIFHPHPDKHNIKKENIGLIEVMGLAVLPARLQTEMERLKQLALSGVDLRGDELTAKHAAWFEAFAAGREVCPENIDSLLREAIGQTFAAVLGDAGVFKDSPEGDAALARFIETV